jgi:FtsH-binding integral membrane protein
MADSLGNKDSIVQRFLEEMREYLIISIYLWICFSVLLLYKTAILRAEQVQFIPLGIAALKALIIGKFILIGKAVKAGNRFSSRILLIRIMWKSLMFMLLLVVFTLIEEIVLGLIHGHTVADTVNDLTARSWLELLAPSVVMLLVLIPMISFEEIDQDLGKGKLRRMLFGRSNADTK